MRRSYEDEYKTVLPACWKVWFPTLMVAFYWVPPQFRVMWCAAVGLGYLSYLARHCMIPNIFLCAHNLCTLAPCVISGPTSYLSPMLQARKDSIKSIDFASICSELPWPTAAGLRPPANLMPTYAVNVPALLRMNAPI